MTPQQAYKRMEKIRLNLAASVLRTLTAAGARITSEAKRSMPKMSTKIDPFTRLLVEPPNPPPGPLGKRTGELAKSISSAAKRYGNRYVIEVTAAVPYAAIHEFGGQTGPHPIAARNAPMLVFNWPKNPWLYPEPPIYTFEVVNHPGSKIPARPFLTPAVEKLAPAIREQLAAQIANFVNRTWGT